METTQSKKYVKTYSTSLASGEMPIRTTLRLDPTPEWPSSRIQIVIQAGQNIEKKGHFYTVDRVVS